MVIKPDISANNDTIICFIYSSLPIYPISSNESYPKTIFNCSSLFLFISFLHYNKSL